MSTLYVIPTPIGNLGDITIRAIEVLKKLEVLLSEDTRMTLKLLGLLGIDSKNKRLIKYFDHNEMNRVSEIVAMLDNGCDIGIVSDAGTPVINDPGYKLIKAVRKTSHKIEVLPGATSITTALVASTLPPDKFFFLGYLPRKTGELTKLLSSTLTSDIKCTYIAFESPHRIVKTLELMHSIFMDKVQVVVCKELTKLHESVELGTPLELLEILKNDKYVEKGEVVVLFNIGY
ncbi:16S rRNA (cytidine(1402)-2'-O)-methyltransferase [candidate division WWE3 bacterium CG_4_9_14_0_2_um_filter_35_11]|uniref:Ribosomal RNA small subunit methyltransferase I n=1 Tax=candidate division WWE3 bacterium CG_4_9_14_0_2_um_filter_35_11 TaxID=1975077 RepID=A0A2M8EL98_UNCKA|nr:MAG: 16S rRNA (cytidine(1402)-2'-O)-methyltransferase [candidate division WWE3 bacterium CG10_big_fil_rev_8_21_14_0_10_35_32]PJC23508.1 MAG: 16S rRNA (cytidine(1402)-2'-O)-methyltransferase [candidate division WWE3 bacterium CG_4_9_14_0_2_um_filter_35_11]